jgi:hypothetical protein
MSRDKSPSAKTPQQWAEVGVDVDKMRAKGWDYMILEPGQETELEYTVGIGGDYEFQPHPRATDSFGQLPPNVTPRSEGVKMATDTKQPVQMFVIRDMHTAESGWYDANSVAMMDSRLITVVGWVVTDDGVHTHIASVWDPYTERYGDGVIVPNVNIVERHVIG